MEGKEFSIIRHYLGKSQSQLAVLLCVSTKAIASYEEGWRRVPAHAERELLFLLSLKRSKDESVKPCWEIKKCHPDWREKCAAWEFKAGHLCWLVNGTLCQGECQDDWHSKIQICRRCEVFQAMIPAVPDYSPDR